MENINIDTTRTGSLGFFKPSSVFENYGVIVEKNILAHTIFGLTLFYTQFTAPFLL